MLLLLINLINSLRLRQGVLPHTSITKLKLLIEMHVERETVDVIQVVVDHLPPEKVNTYIQDRLLQRQRTQKFVSHLFICVSFSSVRCFMHCLTEKLERFGMGEKLELLLYFFYSRKLKSTLFQRTQRVEGMCFSLGIF